ncbi:hypothetical protein Dsin_006036 [Dipteronia sinensis]|uniref:Uncharacterized protein n=1 Tax=Dipteronia sinensis TaxID=43782 RepID=A0AAE0AYZ9_9ROSI|nr:hypothetical protein Dsin_006036 [Dipteronia sinensis]
MEPEITEENDDDEEASWITSFQKEKIRKIIEYQKSLYWSSSVSASSSSSSFSSAAASCSSSCRGSSRSSLLELMKVGSTSLRRLFDMEHTSLATYFDNYSGSPITKPVPLWGSDTEDDEHYDPWESIKQIGFSGNPQIDQQSNFASDGSFRFDGQHKSMKICSRKLKRKKSFRRLPGFGLWICRGFRFRLRLRRLRFFICGRKFCN